MSYIEGIIHIVRDNPRMSDTQLLIKIEKYMTDNWIAITGYGDE